MVLKVAVWPVMFPPSSFQKKKLLHYLSVAKNLVKKLRAHSVQGMP